MAFLYGGKTLQRIMKTKNMVSIIKCLHALSPAIVTAVADVWSMRATLVRTSEGKELLSGVEEKTLSPNKCLPSAATADQIRPVGTLGVFREYRPQSPYCGPTGNVAPGGG